MLTLDFAKGQNYLSIFASKKKNLYIGKRFKLGFKQ